MNLSSFDSLFNKTNPQIDEIDLQIQNRNKGMMAFLNVLATPMTDYFLKQKFETVIQDWERGLSQLKAQTSKLDHEQIQKIQKTQERIVNHRCIKLNRRNYN